MAAVVGICRTRVIQYLNLMRIPADLRARLKGMPDLTEARLRPTVKPNTVHQRRALERIAGPNPSSEAALA